MATNSYNLPTEEEQVQESAEEQQKEAPAFPTELNPEQIHAYAKYKLDSGEAEKLLKQLDEACKKPANDNEIAQVVCAVDTSWPARIFRKGWDKLGPKTQWGIMKVTTPIPLLPFDLGPLQILEKGGLIAYKGRKGSTLEETEKNIREAGGSQRILAKNAVKLGVMAAKVSKDPELQVFALVEPFVEPIATAIDSLEHGAENLRATVRKNREEWEKQQRDIEGISENTQKEVKAQLPQTQPSKVINPRPARQRITPSIKKAA